MTQKIRDVHTHIAVAQLFIYVCTCLTQISVHYKKQSKNSNYPVMCLMFFLMFTVPGIRYFKLKVFVGCWGHSHKSQSQARNIIQKLPGSR